MNKSILLYCEIDVKNFESLWAISNFQKNFENDPTNISTYFIKKLNNQLEEEYCPEILGGFRAINEYGINNYLEQNLNIEPHIFYNENIEETNEEKETNLINIKNNNKISFELIKLFDIFGDSNERFSPIDDYYNLENIIPIKYNFINSNFFSINSNKEKKRRYINW